MKQRINIKNKYKESIRLNIFLFTLEILRLTNILLFYRYKYIIITIMFNINIEIQII